MVGIQKGPERPIVFDHVDDLKLCPAPRDISWNPGALTSKTLCASTFVAIMQYRFGLGWPTVGRGGLRALWRIDRGLSWPAVEEGGRLPR